MIPQPSTKYGTSFRSRTRLGFFLTGLHWALATRLAAQEDRVSYKFQDYEERAGRIQVLSHAALFEQTMPWEGRLGLTGVIDTISGASPNGEAAPAGSDQVPLSPSITDRRRALSVTYAQPWGRFTPSGLIYYSTESDYLSRGYAFNLAVDFNKKNTTLLTGLAYSNDTVDALPLGAWKPKRSWDYLIGLSQLLDPHTIFRLNYTFSRARGYLSDPYKIISAEFDVGGFLLYQTPAENRPNRRDKHILLTSLNRNFASLQGSAEVSYRYFRDDQGINAHTLEAKWFQHLGNGFTLEPFVRFYQQTQAAYYYTTLIGSGVAWDYLPTGQAPFYSSDYRLSHFRAWDYGLKVIALVADRLTIDVCGEVYQMMGRDNATPDSAYITAVILTTGASWKF